MGNERRKRDGNRRDSYGFKISELLTHLAVKKTPPSGIFQRGFLPSLLPPLPVIMGNASIVPGTTRYRALLPDCIQRLSDTQCRRGHHQRQSMPHPTSTPTPAPAPASTPTLRTPGLTPATTPAPAKASQSGKECASLAPPDWFFLPYLAAREKVRCYDSLSSIRDRLHRGELCPDILGVREWTDQRPRVPWKKLSPQRMSMEPGVTSVRYFEDLRDLQRRLFCGILWTSAGPRSPQRDQGALPRTLRTISLKRPVNDTSLRCSPPLISRNDIYYTAFTPPK